MSSGDKSLVLTGYIIYSYKVLHFKSSKWSHQLVFTSKDPTRFFLIQMIPADVKMLIVYW